jgi:hypothetical protein
MKRLHLRTRGLHPLDSSFEKSCPGGLHEYDPCRRKHRMSSVELWIAFVLSCDWTLNEATKSRSKELSHNTNKNSF